MPLATVIAGRYSTTYTHPSGSALDLGVTVSPGGWKISFTPSWKWIGPTDAYGDAVVDKIWRGFRDVGVSAVSKEWKAGTVRASNPASAYTATGTTNFDAGLTGRRASDIGGALILTVTAGTPAASSPATATFTTVFFRDGFRFEWMLDSIERDLPLDFEVLAASDGASPAMPRYWAAT